MKIVLLATLLTFATCIVGILGIDFLDTESAIVRRSPEPDNGGLFGYSAVLHKFLLEGDTFNNMRYCTSMGIT